MEPPQLGILSPGFLQQCAHEAPQLSGTLPSTTFPTHTAKLSALGHTCPPPHTHTRTGSGGGGTPPHLPIPQSHPGPWLCHKTGPTLPSLPPKGGHSEESYSDPCLGTRLQEGEEEAEAEGRVVEVSVAVSFSLPEAWAMLGHG